jgi:hypothetical protein
MITWGLGLAVAFGVAACAAERKATTAVSKSATADQSYAGWYMQHADRSTFQPCGVDKPWRITTFADLPAKAKAFGLDDDTPVFVRIAGSAHDDEIAVARVEQFGSPTPVRDCALTGVVVPPARR